MLKTVASASITGQLSYQGTWNASTNSPTLTSSVGTLNQYYVVSVAGTTTLNGINQWAVGDWVIFNGSVWERVEGSSSEIFTTLTVTGTGNITNLVSGNVTLTGGTISANVISGNVAVANEANNLVGGGNNYLVYQSSANTTTFLAPGTSGYPLVAVASSPPAFTGTLNIPNGTFGNLTSSNVNITGGTINVQATNHTATTNANATMSTASIPLVPQGYMLFDLNGTVVKVPYYAV